MDTHKNAHLTPKGREEMVRAVVDRGPLRQRAATIAEFGFSDLPVPVAETQRTIAPGTGCYSARKAALEQTLLQEMTAPLTIVRPAAVYGPGSRSPREWWFLKRLLDGRVTVPLAFEGTCSRST